MIEYVLQSNMLQTPNQCSCCFDLYTFWDKRIVRKIGSLNVDPGPKARKTGHVSDPVNFFKRFVTQVETCVHHFDPESKSQSKQRKHSGTPPSKKFKQNASVGKVMASVF